MNGLSLLRSAVNPGIVYQYVQPAKDLDSFRNHIGCTFLVSYVCHNGCGLSSLCFDGIHRSLQRLYGPV